MRKFIFILLIALLALNTAIAVKSYFFHPKVYPFKSWFFAWAGDTKFIESDENIINKTELNRLRSLLHPGDIFLNRSDYYISNIGIPGFWTHACLYVGTPKERNAFFLMDMEVEDWVKSKGVASGNLDELLHCSFDMKLKNQKSKWQEKTIIESISEGVVLSSFESGASKDGLVVLRPMLSEREIAEAIYKAFGYVDKSYDYNFDFSTDTLIACTELVYKAYKPADLFPVNDMFGKPFSTANEIAKYCDANYERPTLKLSLIYIYDGDRGYTAENDTAHIIFRNSWNESLW